LWHLFARIQENREMRTTLAIVALAAVTLAAPTRAADAFKREKFDEAGFAAIFDGKTLSGWHVSAQTGHSRASKNQSGGRWVVENGAITGSQDVPGNGGIILTDTPYRNFEEASTARGCRAAFTAAISPSSTR
jgi:hypothetical protein